MRRLDQSMAEAAAGALPDPVTPEQRTRYRTLKVMCHSSGLAATYAYVVSKSQSGGKEDARREAYEKTGRAIAECLVGMRLLDDGEKGDPRAVLNRLGSMDPVDYLRASARVTALLVWLSRLADALVVDQPKTGAGRYGPGADDGA